MLRPHRLIFLIILIVFAGTACSGGAASDDVQLDLGDGPTVGLPDDPSGPLFEEGDVEAEGDGLCEQYAAEIASMEENVALLRAEVENARAQESAACTKRPCDVAEACSIYRHHAEQEVIPQIERCRQLVGKKQEERDALRATRQERESVLEKMVSGGRELFTFDCGTGGSICQPQGSLWKDSYWEIDGAILQLSAAQRACHAEEREARAQFPTEDGFPGKTPAREWTSAVVPTAEVVQIDAALPEGERATADVGYEDLSAESTCSDLQERWRELRETTLRLRAERNAAKKNSARCDERFAQACSRGSLHCETFRTWLQELQSISDACEAHTDALRDEIDAMEEVYREWEEGGSVYAVAAAAQEACESKFDDALAWIAQRKVFLPPAAESEPGAGAIGNTSIAHPVEDVLCGDDRIMVGFDAVDDRGTIVAVTPLCQPWMAGKGLYEMGWPLNDEVFSADGAKRVTCPEGYAIAGLFGSEDRILSRGGGDRLIGSLAALCQRVGERGIVSLGSRDRRYPMTTMVVDKWEGDIRFVGEITNDHLPGGRPRDLQMRNELLNSMQYTGCPLGAVPRGYRLHRSSTSRVASVKMELLCTPFQVGPSVEMEVFSSPMMMDEEVFFAHGPEGERYLDHEVKPGVTYLGHDVSHERDNEGVTAQEYADHMGAEVAGNELVITGVKLVFDRGQLEFLKPIFERLAHVHNGSLIDMASWVPHPPDEFGLHPESKDVEKVYSLRCPVGHVVTGMLGSEHLVRIGLQCSPVVESGVRTDWSFWTMTGKDRRLGFGKKTEVVLCNGDGGGRRVATGIIGTSDKDVQQLKLQCSTIL